MPIKLIGCHQRNLSPTQTGLSIIELIVSIAIFAIIAASSISAILGAFSTSRLAKEESRATFFNVEGLEATESIRNQDWANLVNGDHGLSFGGGNWTFSGTSDLDGSGKYTRVVNVSDVERDGNDDIVASGGTIDPDTKKIISTVSWDFTPTRNNQIQKTLYLTNWQKSIGAGSSGVGPPTPTPTPTPPVIPTCGPFCQGLGYSGGSCRQNTQQCNNNGETPEAGGDANCTTPNSDTCCCTP